MEESERQARDGGKREKGKQCGIARDKQVMGRSKRHASEGEEQETGK
jgi:hypothetical protein